VTRLSAFAAMLLLAAGALASGCGVQLTAVQLKVNVDNGSMTLVEPESGRFHGGEVVITVVNATDQKRQFTLAETSSPPKKLPEGIVSALSYRDDSRVVDVTGVMREAKVELRYGALPEPQPTETKLHVYLKPNTPYLLFDRLGGYRDGYSLRLEAHSS
jgi:hypothetical protein